MEIVIAVWTRMSSARMVSIFLVACLLGQTFCRPAAVRVRRGFNNNEVDSREKLLALAIKDLENAGVVKRQIRQNEITSMKDSSERIAFTSSSSTTPDPFYDDDDDFDSLETIQTSSTGGGSSIFSLLRLVGALFPGSSGGNVLIRRIIRDFIFRNQASIVPLLNANYLRNQAAKFKINRRHDVNNNEIDIDSNKITKHYIVGLKPPPVQKQQIEESHSESESFSDSDHDSNEGNDSESHNSESLNSESHNSESLNSESLDSESSASESHDSDSLDSDSHDSESLASQSLDSENHESESYEKDHDNAAEESIEDNQSANGDKSKSKQDSASVSDDDDYSDEPPGGGDGQGGGILGLLAGLSGGEDGQSDLGSLLAAVSGIVANLSGDGIDLNALIASGLGLFVGLLSGDEQNPGAVLASYLLTSLDTISGGGANNNGAFFGTFISKLVKGTSAGQSAGQQQQSSPIWTLKMSILRAVLQFGTSILGLASSSSTNAITN